MSSKITFAVRGSRIDNTSMVSEGTVFGNQLEGGGGSGGLNGWAGGSPFGRITGINMRE